MCKIWIEQNVYKNGILISKMVHEIKFKKIVIFDITNINCCILYSSSCIKKYLFCGTANGMRANITIDIEYNIVWLAIVVLLILCVFLFIRIENVRAIIHNAHTMSNGFVINSEWVLEWMSFQLSRENLRFIQPIGR